MSKKTFIILLFTILLFCLKFIIAADKKEIDNKNNNKYEIVTGFYLLNNTETSIKRILIKSNETYKIDSTPLVSVSHFTKIQRFHEKDCYNMSIWLDNKGSELLDSVIKKNNEGKIGIIINNQLIRIQELNDTQFARVDKNDDPREYGHVLAFPCNSFNANELIEFEKLIKN
jgi:hypothetical protein